MIPGRQSKNNRASKWPNGLRKIPNRWRKPRRKNRPLGGSFAAVIVINWQSHLWLEWQFQWSVYFLSRTTLFLLLEYCGRLSILVAVIFYALETPQRTMMRHYQAWQVINSAQGKGGSGGRIEVAARTQ